MLSIHYFASLREQIETETEQVPLPSGDGGATVADLVLLLIAKDPDRRTILGDSSQVLVAVNQQVVSRDTQLGDGDEVAFFPPMTGG